MKAKPNEISRAVKERRHELKDEKSEGNCTSDVYLYRRILHIHIQGAQRKRK